MTIITTETGHDVLTARTLNIQPNEALPNVTSMTVKYHFSKNPYDKSWSFTIRGLSNKEPFIQQMIAYETLFPINIRVSDTLRYTVRYPLSVTYDEVWLPDDFVEYTLTIVTADILPDSKT